MNAYLNYLLEASIGLCLFLLVYQVLLRKETSFRLNRIFLLLAIIASLTFPLFTIDTADSPVPSLSLSVEPETVPDTPTPASEPIPEPAALSTWQIIGIVYAAGLFVFLIVFVIRLTGIVKALKRSFKYTYNNHNIVELKGEHSPFSFFNYIFISSAPPLSEKEKQQIIEHEGIHARLYHSIDILLINALGILFWFNPVIRIYKKIFVQLHEFEADARAVEKHDVNEYCSLLARVALHSADYKLANHFSNSLTIKRIEMMRTLKQKIKSWKIVAIAAFLPLLFVVVACQDQVENTPQEKYIERPFKYPSAVEDALADLHKKHPHDLFITLSPWGESIQLDENQKNQRNVKLNDKTTFTADAIIAIKTDDKNIKGEQEVWVIFQYEGGLPERTQLNGITEEYREIDARPVFTAVETPAVPPGGLTQFWHRLKDKINYPASAKRNGIEGKVFIKFIIWSDGKLSGFEIVKGINKELDLEALRVLKEQSAHGWTPGMQNGGKVNSQYVLPIEFRLN